MSRKKELKVYIDIEQYDRLRKAAFNTNCSMSEFAREALENRLNDEELEDLKTSDFTDSYLKDRLNSLVIS